MPLLAGLLLAPFLGAAAPPQAPSEGPPTAWLSDAVPSDYTLRTGGQHRLVGQATNFDRHSLVVTGNQSSVSFAALRLRQWFNLVHEQRDHGIYTQLEVGHLFFGEDEEFPKTFGSVDETGVELRRGFLWLEPWDDALLRVGVVDWHDSFGDRPAPYAGLAAIDDYSRARSVLANSVWDFNVAGLTLDGKLSDRVAYRGGLMWLSEGDDTLTGSGAAFLATGDVDVAVGSGSLDSGAVDSGAVGASVYFLHDNGDYSYGTFGGPGMPYDSSWDLWTGLRAHVDVGDITASAYAILNTGETDDPDWRHTGWAARVAVDTRVSQSTVAAQVLYATGDDGSSSSRSDEFRTIAQSERDDLGAQGYWSFVGLSSPHGPADVNDLGVGLQNRGLGLVTAQLAATVPIAEGWSGYAAAAWLRADESNPANGNRDIGLELLAQLSHRLSEQLAVDFGLAWLDTGEFYRDFAQGHPDDLYSLFLRIQLEL